jgi:hypothetical protein
MINSKLVALVVALIVVLGGISVYFGFSFTPRTEVDAKAVAKELHELQKKDEEEKQARARAEDERKRRESANTVITNPYR